MNNQQYNEEFNGFDEMTGLVNSVEVERLKIEAEVERNKISYLLHQVFVQSEQGRKLIDVWKETLINTPSFDGNSSQFDAGLNEGEKRFVRNILLLLKQVEDS